ncbi:benzoate 4-monooxygenase cytochrome P450 [Stipitochalara longipes BDJ]|nr:benzoate 4-monooxygenase cytochrome P450 [Stipitochalara longipes BDJ]
MMGLITLSGSNFGSILELWSWLNATAMVIGALVFYVSWRAIYNIYFHPLSKFPGPKFAAISYLFYSRTAVSGDLVKTMVALHDKYGDVVRWTPDELSFNSVEAWKDIYTPSKKGEVFVRLLIITQDPAFSNKALFQQQNVVLKYVNMLMTAIQEESRKGPINLVEYFNWVTSDVLGELAFSEAFGSVENRKTNSWIATLFNAIKFTAYDDAILRLSPFIWKHLHFFVPQKIRVAAINHIHQSKDKLLARIAKTDSLEHRDMCSYILEKKDEFGMNDWNLTGYAQTLIMAGSETTATAFCGLTYYLCRTPEVYQKLKDEIRGRFKTADEITIHTATFPYLTAVINEALRIFPPVPITLPRVTPKGGAMVAGVFVPGGAIVGVQSWCVTHNPKYFKDPHTFRPERWLDPDCTDNLSASQPFLLGSRNCIGQTMAMMELRILIAKIVFLFDFKLVDDNLDWDRDGECYRLWQKPPLWTEVTMREGS